VSARSPRAEGIFRRVASEKSTTQRDLAADASKLQASKPPASKLAGTAKRKQLPGDLDSFLVRNFHARAVGAGRNKLPWLAAKGTRFQLSDARTSSLRTWKET